MEAAVLECFAHVLPPATFVEDVIDQPARAQFEAFLDDHRRELNSCLDGLTEQQARRSLVRSQTTLLGLVKHATFVEKVWFHSRVAGVPRAELGLPDTVDESFVLDPHDTVESVRAAFLAACEHSRTVAASHELDEEFPWHQGPVSLRYVYAHLVAELARLAGHGDILVEQIRSRRS